MPSILLIEDDAPFREALALALTERGFQVMQARDGEEGLRLFQGVPADLVVTDIVMPNREGTAVVSELHRSHPHVGIIAMSGGLAHNAPLYLTIAAAFGARRTLQKPFHPEALFRAIDEILAAQAAPRSDAGSGD